MKKKLFLLLSSFAVLIIYCSDGMYAQNKLTIKNITGVWQFGSPRLGDEINQNFIFFNNGNFIFNNGKHGDDVVSTLQLKGRYRFNQNRMYFTIISRIIADHSTIGVVNPNLDFGIFQYIDGGPKEILEKNPKEIEDPADITIINLNHIKINDEDYYKVSSDPKNIDKL